MRLSPKRKRKFFPKSQRKTRIRVIKMIRNLPKLPLLKIRKLRLK